MRFKDRADAGRKLAGKLGAYENRPEAIALGLPRGGVPVALEVARSLGLQVDAFLVRKLGVPAYPELAMGAIAEGGVEVRDEPLIARLDLPSSRVDQIAARERLELERRSDAYRAGRLRPPLNDRVVVLIDDGLATGMTMEAAIAALRQSHPSRVVVAAPVGSRETCARIARLADEVVCAEMPEHFEAVSLWYESFPQVSDDEVRQLLAQATL